MSKRELTNYIKSLTKKQLEEQIIDLYTRFNDVKTYYNFAFNPNEKKLLTDFKQKVSKEYFPVNARRPKTRVSVAQKYIKQFIQLQADNNLIADAMLYNIEIAQTYSHGRTFIKPAFYASMLKSYNQAFSFITHNGLISIYNNRLQKIANEAKIQRWPNYKAFII